MSTNRCMEKRCGIYIYSHTHIYNGILVIKKNEILPFAKTQMDLENIMLSEINQTKTNAIYHLYQCMKVKRESEIAESCPTLSDPMDCGPPGFSVHGIFQARVLEWDAVAFSMTYLLALDKSRIRLCDLSKLCDFPETQFPYLIKGLRLGKWFFTGGGEVEFVPWRTCDSVWRYFQLLSLSGEEVLMTSNGQKPRIPLNILQYIGHSAKQRIAWKWSRFGLFSSVLYCLLEIIFSNWSHIPPDQNHTPFLF